MHGLQAISILWVVFVIFAAIAIIITVSNNKSEYLSSHHIVFPFNYSISSHFTKSKFSLHSMQATQQTSFATFLKKLFVICVVIIILILKI